MRTFPLFAVLFFAVPIVEIYLLIQVGEVIGAFPTILLVISTAVLGGFLLRQQGLSTLARYQQSVAQGQLPATQLLEGVFLLVGGVLLMTPGFFTDALGLLCLLPWSRRFMIARMIKRFHVRTFGASAQHSPSSHSPESAPTRETSSPATLEGEFIRKDEP